MTFDWLAFLYGMAAAWFLAWKLLRPRGAPMPPGTGSRIRNEASGFLAEAWAALRPRAWRSDRQMELAIHTALTYIEAARAHLAYGAHVTKPPAPPAELPPPGTHH